MSVFPPSFPDQLDPQQSRALHACMENEQVWVHGPDKEKRMQLLVHLLLANLQQERRTLVCIPPEDEHLLTQELAGYQLDHLIMSLHGSLKPTAAAALQVARKKDVREDTASQSELALNQYHTQQHTEEARYRALQKNVFGQMSWKQLVDKSAQGPRDTFKCQLAAALVTSDFELSQQEYWHIRGRIKTFQRLRVLRTPSFDLLDCLNNSIFAQEADSEAKAIIQKELEDLTKQGRNLLRQIGELVNHYRQDITGVQHQRLDDLKSDMHKIETLLASGQMQYGAEFYAESTFNDLSNRIKRSVSKKSRAMHSMRERIREAFTSMVGKMMELPVKHSEIEEDILGEPLTMEYVAEQVAHSLKVIDGWARQIDARATDHKRRLNARNIPHGHVLRKMIHDVETRISDYISYVNERAIFSEAMEINALSLEKRSLVIKDVVTLCMKLQEAMVDFEAYYLWRSFWSQLDKNIKTLLEGLDIMDERDQVSAFDAWYFENVLDQVPPSQIAQAGETQNGAEGHEQELAAVLFHHLRSQGRSTRHQALRSMRSSQKQLVGHIAKNRLRELTDELRVIPANDLFSIFPIVCCRPADLRDYAYYSDMLCVIDSHGVDYKAYIAQSKRCVMITEHIPKVPDDTLQRMEFRQLEIHRMNTTFDWRTLPATGKLGHLQDLTSQLAPFLGELKVYNGRQMQLLSFMGEICDQYVLKKLEMPYKVIGEEEPLTIAHLTEAFLDTGKPIALLTRDRSLGYQFTGHIAWQHEVLELFAHCGVNVMNAWSMDLKRTGLSALDPLVEALREVLRFEDPKETSSMESVNLTDHDDRSKSRTVPGETSGETRERDPGGIRPGTKEVGGVPA